MVYKHQIMTHSESGFVVCYFRMDKDAVEILEIFSELSDALEYSEKQIEIGIGACVFNMDYFSGIQAHMAKLAEMG